MRGRGWRSLSCGTHNSATWASQPPLPHRPSQQNLKSITPCYKVAVDSFLHRDGVLLYVRALPSFPCTAKQGRCRIRSGHGTTMPPKTSPAMLQTADSIVNGQGTSSALPAPAVRYAALQIQTGRWQVGSELLPVPRLNQAAGTLLKPFPPPGQPHKAGGTTCAEANAPPLASAPAAVGLSTARGLGG